MSVGVSIVMPVYNAERFLGTAIDSILDQDFEDYELLLIDDGSTDTSGQICDNYSQKHTNIRVLHIENGGMCKARNIGMSYANGAYITFCDNDDVVLPGFLAENYKVAQESGADCVRFGRRQLLFNEYGSAIQHGYCCPSGKKAITRLEFLANLDYLFSTETVWTGFYRREFLESFQIKFDETFRRGLEDVLFNVDVYLKASSLAFNPGVYYEWRRRPSQSSSLVVDNNMFESLNVCLSRKTAFLKEIGVLEVNPSFLSEAILRTTKGCLTRNLHTGGTNYAIEASVFDAVRSVLLIYKEDLYQKAPASLEYRIMRDLLMNKRYRLLYAYLSFGVRLRQLQHRFMSKIPTTVPLASS